MPISQKNKPIVFLLFGGGVPIPVPFGVPMIGLVRPEHLSIERVARGTLTHTADAAFLDDFGEGVPVLTMSGHTGWNQNVVAGLVGFKAMEAQFVEYLARRKRLMAAGVDPNIAQLWYLDTLNLEAFSVYPMKFKLLRTRQRPLLYQYQAEFVVLKDLLQDAIYSALDSGVTLGSAAAAGGFETLAENFETDLDLSGAEIDFSGASDLA